MPLTKNPPLSDLQEWMRWVLTHPEGVEQALGSRHPLKDCLRVIGETPAVNRETRLSIYGDGYFLRIVEALGGNFSSVKNVVGEHDFGHIARAYLVKHPSTFKSIDDIGHHLADFLKRHPLSRKFPFLPDLALLEWTTHQSFFADDVPRLDPDLLKKIPETAWRKARFTLDPSVRLLKLHWPVDELWRDDGNWGPARLRGLKKSPLQILVFRLPEKFIRVPRLNAVQYDLLQLLGKNKPLGAALLAVAKKHSFRDHSPVSSWFKSWIENGVFTLIRA